MRSLGWMLIQYDWCHYKKGKFAAREDMSREKTKCKETKEEHSYLQVKESCLEL